MFGSSSNIVQTNVMLPWCLVVFFHLLICLATSLTGTFWHFTDVHVDPWYVVGSDSTKCFCQTYESCPRMGTECNITGNAGTYGNSAGNCATPKALYSSAVSFMQETQSSPDFIFFTGDFCEKGASESCSSSSNAQDQILDIIHYGYNTLKEAFPNAPIFNVFGNHDSVPGHQFPGPPGMDWLYSNLSVLWNVNLTSGGYYSTHFSGDMMHVKIIGLNSNYFARLNPYLSNTSDSAYKEGLKQMNWLGNELEMAKKSGINVYILLHIPPRGWYNEFATLYQIYIGRYSEIIKGQFFGHDHNDYFTFTRKCGDDNLNNTNQTCMGDPTGVCFISPSLTEGYPPENPGLRLFGYDYTSCGFESFDIISSKTFYTNLTLSNMNNEMKWMFEYDAQSIYNMPDLSVDSWYNVSQNFATNDKLWDIFSGLYYRKYVDRPDCQGTCRDELVCQIQYAGLNAESVCNSESKRTTFLAKLF